MKAPGLTILAALLCLASAAACSGCGKGTGKDRDGGGALPPIEDPAAGDASATAPIVSRRPDSFAGIVKKVKDIVVNISTKQVVAGQPPNAFPFGFLSPHDVPYKKQVRTGLGSGFVIDKSGIVITNNHVIKDAAEVLVQLPDKRELPAGIIGKDERLDIAVLQIPEAVSVEAVLGDSDLLEVGDWIIAIGNPLGLANTVTAGIVSARGRSSWDLWGEIPGYADFIQTDASINPGNSGGPLVNLAGEVVGVNTAIIKEAQGIGFAIPVNMVKQVLPQLIKDGRITRAWMGIYLARVDSDMAAKLDLPAPKGALIAEVVEEGPAHEAGLRPGDVIVEFDGKEITEAGKLPWIIATSPIGSPLKVKVIREGKEKEVEVTLLPMPQGS
jgi:serine protease Do